MNVIINEAIKEYISHRKIYHSRSFLFENSLRIIFVPLSKKQRLSCSRSRLIVLLLRQTIFRMPFASLGIVLVKHMVKQSELIFFPSDKKIESRYFIDN